MKSYRNIAVLLAGSLVVASSTRAAEPAYTVAQENDVLESFFTLEFPEPLGSTFGAISRTDLVMRYEFEADGLAKFLDYDQDVDSLTIPDGQGGGIETGAITVRILDSQPVALEFDPDSGVGAFETLDVYAVYFEGDLSAFGIESPFILESTSTGSIQFDKGSESSGLIDMVWEGDGVIGQGPFQLPFIYRCEVHTQFIIPDESDFNGDGAIDDTDWKFFLMCAGAQGGVQLDSPLCEMADFDGDNDIDRRDWMVMLANLD